MEAPSSWIDERLLSARWRAYQNLLPALVLVCLLLGSALLLIARRSAGAFSEPLSPGALLVVGSCVAAAVVGARRLGGRGTSSGLRWLNLLVQWGPTVAVAMYGVALAIEGTSLPALTLYLVLIVGAEFFAERSIGTKQARGPSENIRPESRASALAEPGSHAVSPPGDPSENGHRPESSAVDLETPPAGTETLQWEARPEAETLDELPEMMPEDAWQQITRVRTAVGEVISGWVKAEFEPGERTAVLHVAFCPPLAKAPEVEIEQLSGPAARIKAAQVLPQGARLEIRLHAPAVESELLTLAFVATDEGEDSL